MGKFDDWVMKTYRARKRFRMAGTSIIFSPMFCTDDPTQQDKIESHPWFRTGVIYEVTKKAESENTDAAIEAAKDPRAELLGLQRRDLQALAKRLEISGGGTNVDIVSRIVESSEESAKGTAV